MKKDDRGNYHIIWSHEAFQAEMIAHDLISPEEDFHGNFFQFLIISLVKWFRLGKKVRETRENLLFTKRLAFDAAKKTAHGMNRKEALGAVEYEAKKILARDRAGSNSEGLRKKQMVEIELLMDHYRKAFNSKELQYMAIIRSIYRTRSEYESFIKELEKVEDEIIEADVSSTEQWDKAGRLDWLNKVKNATCGFRINEMDNIFSEE